MKKVLIPVAVILLSSVAPAQTRSGGTSAGETTPSGGIAGGNPAVTQGVLAATEVVPGSTSGVSGMTATPVQNTIPGQTPSQTTTTTPSQRTTTTPSQSTTTTPSQNTTTTPSQNTVAAPGAAGGAPAVTSSPVGALPGAPNNTIGSTINTVAAPCGALPGTTANSAATGTTSTAGVTNPATGMPAVGATVGGASTVIGNTNVNSPGAAVTTNTVAQPCVPGSGIPTTILPAATPTPTPSPTPHI